MAYTPQNWKNKGAVGAIAINADHLNNMETGIDEAHEHIDDVATGHHHDGTDSRKVSHTNLLAKGVNTHSQIDVHLASTSNPHSITAIQVTNTPSGDVTATNVQAAINEIDAEKISSDDIIDCGTY